MAHHNSANATVAAHDARIVTPSDSTVLAVTRSLFIGTTGNINVRMADGTTLVFSNVPVGIFPVQVDQVLSTSTTASNIIALY